MSTSSHTDQVLELLRKLMEYRSDEVRHRLEKVGRAASMLHVDVLVFIITSPDSAWKYYGDCALRWRKHDRRRV